MLNLKLRLRELRRNSEVVQNTQPSLPHTKLKHFWKWVDRQERIGPLSLYHFNKSFPNIQGKYSQTSTITPEK